MPDMKALTVVCSAWLAAAMLVGRAAGVAAQPPGGDLLARARQLYNAGQFDAAITAVREATRRGNPDSEANLLLGRALLERHRAGRAAEDLAAARAALWAVQPASLTDRGRVDLIVGLGEAVYLDGQYRSAAGLLEPVLEQMGLLPAVAREQVVDWWATAMDRYAQTLPPEQRTAVYDDLSARIRLHLGRYPDSSAASYWLPAAALARGDLELAWDLALAGWVRSTLAPDEGTTLRGDLDRLVTQALIPERVKRLAEGETAGAAERFASEWDEAKARWKR